MKKIFAVLLATVLMIFSVVPAFAAISPSASIEYDVIIENTEGGKGSYTTEILEDKKHIVIVAHPKDGYEFSHWVIDGKYVIVEGSLNDESLTIKINSDVVATPYFTKDGKPADDQPEQDSGSVSPQTSDFGVNYITIFALALVGLFAVAGVKLATSKK